MRNGPAQRRDRRLLVHHFVQIEKLMDGFIFLPVDGDGKPLFCRPANDLEELVLGRRIGALLLYMAPVIRSPMPLNRSMSSPIPSAGIA